MIGKVEPIARGLMVLFGCDVDHHEPFAACLAISETMLAIIGAERAAGQTAADLRDLLEGLARRR